MSSSYQREIWFLELDRTLVYEFPPELSEMIHLRYLSLRRTMIREFPDVHWKSQELRNTRSQANFHINPASWDTEVKTSFPGCEAISIVLNHFHNGMKGTKSRTFS